MTTPNEITTPAEDVGALEAERQRLSLDAQEGRPGAVRRLDEVESRLAQLQRSEERRRLAERERAARSQAEAEAAVAARRQELQRELDQLLAERLDLAADVEREADGLAAAVTRFLENGQRLYRTSTDLKSAGRPRLLGTDVLHGYLCWRLQPLGLPLPRAAHTYRKSLREILGLSEARREE